MTSALADRPRCATPAADRWLAGIVSKAADFVVTALGPSAIDAVILTGSCARGEATVRHDAGGFRLLGDVEFIVIVRPPFKWPALRRRMVDLGRSATRNIGEDGRAVIEYGPGGPVYLRRNVHPGIFEYDLLHHGRVVWGRADILGDAHSFAAEDIPAADALALLMNRMIELMQPAKMGDGDTDVERAYRLAKTMLDLAGSALASVGRYVSPYGARLDAFAALLDSAPDLRASLDDARSFLRELERATACKLHAQFARASAGELERRTLAVAGWARGLWLWEMRRLVRRPTAGFAALVEAYRAHERRRRRIRGWAKFLVHPLRPRGVVSPLRLVRRVLRASPHAETYAAAMLVFWTWSGAGSQFAVRAASVLPVRRAMTGPVTPEEVGAAWRWLVRNN